MNKNSCYVVFSPKNPADFENRKRFLVTLNTLRNYIGSSNAQAIAVRSSICLTDKCTFRLRKLGKIEIYFK